MRFIHSTAAHRTGLAAHWGTSALALTMAVMTASSLYGQIGETRGASTAGIGTEELVYSRTDDGIVDAGAIFTPSGSADKRVAVIWIHGNGVNFYYPSYVKVGRELARRGLTTIVGNTRMHDLGNIEAFRETANPRGGTYYGITTDQTHDIAAWIQFAKDRGFDRIVLVGHSAGATAVQIYAARTQDARIAGLVIASGKFSAAPATVVDSTRLARARALVAEGHGGDPVPPTQAGARPSPTSAATLVDLAGMGVELTDFYGVQTPAAPVERVRAPILAWFGTNDDVGTPAVLQLLEKSMKKVRGANSGVTTAMIPGSTHMFDGHEAQVADVLANWVHGVLLTGR